jgi:hypothetical protein
MFLLNIITVVKYSRMRWAEHVVPTGSTLKIFEDGNL